MNAVLRNGLPLLSEKEQTALVRICTSLLNENPNIFRQWREEVISSHTVAMPVFEPFSVIFHVVIDEFCPCLSQGKSEEYLTGVLEPAVRDFYLYGGRGEQLMQFFHIWEKILYKTVRARSGSSLAQIFHDVLLLDFFFHVMLASSMSTYFQLEFAHYPLAPLIHLTKRQREILQALADGQDNKTIGCDLGLSPRTVEGHRFQLMRKVGASSLADLLRFGFRSGLIRAGKKKRQTGKIR